MKHPYTAQGKQKILLNPWDSVQAAETTESLFQVPRSSQNWLETRLCESGDSISVVLDISNSDLLQAKHMLLGELRHESASWAQRIRLG